MSNRLRNQEVTVKPRVIVNDGAFKIEWIGKMTGEQCATGAATFEGAVYFAGVMARGNADRVREINEQQRNNRHANILRKRLAAAINQEAA